MQENSQTFYHILSNGIKIVHRWTPSPVAYVGVMVGAGTRDEKPEENGEEYKSIGRNVFYNNDNGKMDYMFQAAVLSTTTEQFTEDERLELAF